MAIIAVNVVDFIPPPVPDGEAPTFIKNIITISIPVENEPIGTVLKPTVVRAVIV